MQDTNTLGLSARTQLSRSTLSKRDRLTVLARIQTLMAYWGITPEELSQAEADNPIPALSKHAVKYRHPLTGETWDGKGSHPDWLRVALLKEGFRLEELKPEMQTFG